MLEVKNLVTEFKTDDGIVKAVNNISFTLNRGETIGIVGESGSGKSVTSLSVMRLIPNPPGRIASGEILYHSKDGKVVDLTKISEEEMRKYRGNEIAMIFQEPMTSLNPVFTCGDQVMEAIMLHQKTTKDQARDITLKMFEKVKLPDPKRVLDAYPHQLSGGQKQRVMIAMALALEPAEPDHTTIRQRDVKCAAPKPRAKSERQPNQARQVGKPRIQVIRRYRDHVRHGDRSTTQCALCPKTRVNLDLRRTRSVPPVGGQREVLASVPPVAKAEAEGIPTQAAAKTGDPSGLRRRHWLPLAC